MDGEKRRPVRRFQDGRLTARTDVLVDEAPVTVEVNEGQARFRMLCLPKDLEALAVGLLLTEGALRTAKDLHDVKVMPREAVVEVRGDVVPEMLAAMTDHWTRGTGCGGGGTSDRGRGPLSGVSEAAPLVTPDQLFTLAKDFQSRAGLWRRTGGVHACALADSGRIRFFAEDVGRHNAFDKVVGMAALGGVAWDDKFILSTGRISTEIIAKAAGCGVPMLVSRSAVTARAADLAERYGLTVIGFLRGARFNIYTRPERIEGVAASRSDGAARRGTQPRRVPPVEKD